MTKSLEATEALGAEGAEHPRITLDYIKSQIEDQWYMTADQTIPVRARLAVADNLKHVTLCVMLMRNGFVVIGKSAPMDPQNFDPAKGRTFAYEDAIRQLWPLFAFAYLSRP